jgi:hypothetical protein
MCSHHHQELPVQETGVWEGEPNQVNQQAFTCYGGLKKHAHSVKMKELDL